MTSMLSRSIFESLGEAASVVCNTNKLQKVILILLFACGRRPSQLTNENDETANPVGAVPPAGGERDEEELRRRHDHHHHEEDEEESSRIADAIIAGLEERLPAARRRVPSIVASEEMVAIRNDFLREGRTGRDLMRRSSLWWTSASATAAASRLSPEQRQQERQLEEEEVVYHHADFPSPCRYPDSAYLAQ